VIKKATLKKFGKVEVKNEFANISNFNDNRTQKRQLLTKITNVAAGKLKNESTTRAFAKFQTSMMIVLKKGTF
jgi:hypothetical protein